MQQFFQSFSLHIIQSLLESAYYDHVNSLGLSIPLGIGWGRTYIHDSQVITVSPKGLTIKLKAVVRDEGTKDPEPGDNVFPDKFLGIHVPNICQRLDFNPLGEVVCTDQ